MIKVRHFFKTTLLGGVVILLPMLLTGFFLRWLFNFVTNLIAPLTRVVVATDSPRLKQYLGDALVILVIILVFFVVGLIVETGFGRYVHKVLEKRLLKAVPGYCLFRNTIKQFLGQRNSPFSRVAMVKPFGDGTMMTAFVTDEHPDGRYTVFAPSALNPTTGLILHLDKENVRLIDASVEDTMRSIISCGAGSSKLLKMLPRR